MYYVQDRFIILSIGNTNTSASTMLLRHIRYLLAVAEHRNFTRAAEALHVSQPTLSQQIRQIEETLGAQLLDRTGRTVRLTDAGEAYVAYAQRAMQNLDAGARAIHDVKELSRGSLRIATTPTFTSYLIGPLLSEFNRRYENITIDLAEMTQDRMEALLAEDMLDVGIAFDDTHSPDIEAHVLFIEQLALMVGQSHVHAGRRRPLPLDNLMQVALILLNRKFATRRYIDGYFAQHKVTPRIAMEVNSVSAVIEVLRHGALSTVLPAAIADEHAELSVVELKPAPPNRTATLLLRKDAYRSAATRAFMELATRLQRPAKRPKKTG